MNLKRKSNGQIITLDPKVLGSGGEAQIYLLKNDESLVAKIYYQYDSDREKKLQIMVANPPDDPMRGTGYITIAWPVDLLLDSQNRVVGFLMPRISKMRQIVNFYNPATRLKQCPSFNYYYLHHTAMNLATAVNAVHNRGYVIADVNESNILVAENAIVTIIDTDSFQVYDKDNNSVYRCPVGKAEYAPPEILNELDNKKEYRLFDRSIESDNFALAVIIFRLLMEGHHPFDGMYTGRGDPPIHYERIKSGHFPYSLKSHGPYQPAKNAPPIEILHPEIKQLFMRCFDDGLKNPQLRPTAREWREKLREAEENLITCSVNSQHCFGNHLNYCPWCERAKKLYEAFPSMDAIKSSQTKIKATTSPITTTKQPPAKKPTTTVTKTTQKTTKRKLGPKIKAFITISIIISIIVTLFITIPIIARNRESNLQQEAKLAENQQVENANQQAEPARQGMNVTKLREIIGKDGAPMVLIPAGEFLMGSNDGDDDEKPVHTVYLDAFYIDKYEVTNAQYKKFMDATGHKAPTYWNDSRFNAPNQPVVGVSWYDAKAYAEWAGKRLPTEAEWEKAARGGLVGKKYVWGDEWPPPSKAGNFDDETAFDSFEIEGYSDGYVYTAPVGSFRPNGYGLYDMAGNVLEWCSDWYDRNYYSVSPRSNPKGPDSGSGRVLRGGSWYTSTTTATSA